MDQYQTVCLSCQREIRTIVKLPGENELDHKFSKMPSPGVEDLKDCLLDERTVK